MLCVAHLHWHTLGAAPHTSVESHRLPAQAPVHSLQALSSASQEPAPCIARASSAQHSLLPAHTALAPHHSALQSSVAFECYSHLLPTHSQPERAATAQNLHSHLCYLLHSAQKMKQRQRQTQGTGEGSQRQAFAAQSQSTKPCAAATAHSTLQGMGSTLRRRRRLSGVAHGSAETSDRNEWRCFEGGRSDEGWAAHQTNTHR